MIQNASASVLRFRAPEPLMTAVRMAAERDMRTVSDFARCALLEKLRAIGMDPTKAAQEGRQNA